MDTVLDLGWLLLWAQAFLLTQLVEVPLYATQLRHLSLWRRLAAAALPSAVTHPLLFVGGPLLVLQIPVCAVAPDSALLAQPACWTAMTVVGETLVVAVEALILRRLGVRHPWSTALAVNACSFVVGLIWEAT